MIELLEYAPEELAAAKQAANLRREQERKKNAPAKIQTTNLKASK